jgi:hypothetical protein
MTAAKRSFMRHRRSTRLLAVIAGGVIVAGGALPPAAAQPLATRYAGHEAWAAYHISSLAPEIKANVLKHEEACGTPFAATHAFAVPTFPDANAVTLHYESLWCAARAGGICNGGKCLHEVYVRDHDRYRLSFRGYAGEVRVDRSGNVFVTNEGN